MKTTYEICHHILLSYATKAAEGIQYTHTNDSGFRHSLLNLHSFISGIDGYKSVDPSLLTLDEMNILGFGRWSEESELMLIPFYLFPFLAEGFTAFNFDGKPFVFKRDEADNDHRYGALAFGVYPAK